MKKAKILIVEDEPLIALELKEKLKDLGYQVVSSVSTAEKAIIKAETSQPDIVLMDIRLKGKMNGIEAADIIRSRFKIPVVFATSHTEEKYLEKAKLTRPYGDLIKPVQERDLRITLDMALYTAKIDSEREILVTELQDALEQVKQLKGLLPICASCKKIRDDKGYWNQIESYIEQHSEALFSHGICPVCAEELYGDTKWFKKRKEKKD